MSNCKLCGKPLSRPDSIEKGYGPECFVLLSAKGKNDIAAGNAPCSSTSREQIKAFQDDFISESFLTESIYKYLKDMNCSISDRVKALSSIERKAKSERYSTRDLNDIDDVVGYRIITPNFKQMLNVAKKLIGSLDIVSAKDMVSEPTFTGYSAIHLLVRKNNKVAEIQIKTQLMNEFAGFMHDKIYKNKELSNKPSIKKYARDMNKHILSLEKGTGELAPMPEFPPELKKLGLEFKAEVPAAFLD